MISFSLPFHRGPDLSFDLRQLPATRIQRGSKVLGVFIIIFSLFWGGLPTICFISTLGSDNFKPAFAFLLIFTFLGAGLFLFGLSQLFYKIETTIKRENVLLQSKSLFGRRQWEEPLDRYEGVLYRSEYHSGGKNRSSYTLYIIELLNNDRKKTIQLYRSRLESGVRARWEDYCRLLNLPAVEKEMGVLIKRDVADLDKSVREMVKEGKLTVKFDPSRMPANDFSVKRCGEMIEITVLNKGISPLGLLIGLIFSGGLIYVGFFINAGIVFFGVFGLLFAVLIAGSTAWAAITRLVIELGTDRIHLRRKTPWGETKGVILLASEIEMVKIGKKGAQGREALLLVTDHGVEKVGGGLSRESLQWLKNCIITIISL